MNMRAIVFSGAGGIEVIGLASVPRPAVGPGQVRVRVRAAALNRADLMQRRGHYPAPHGWPSDIPGLEYAGEVEVSRGDPARWRPGDRVMGLVGGGAQAEYVVVHEDELLAVPATLAWPEAAAIPESFLTAYDALTTRARVHPGERVLVHAAGSGLGTAAVQLAHQLGATVIGTSRSPEKLARAVMFGLDGGINTSGGGFLGELGEPVDVILDVLGGAAFADNIAALAPRGRLVVLGLLSGSHAAADLGDVLRKRIEIIGTVMRTRGHEERAALVREFTSTMLPLFAQGALRPVVDRVVPMDDLAAAHTRMEQNDSFGKLVAVWDD